MCLEEKNNKSSEKIFRIIVKYSARKRKTLKIQKGKVVKAPAGFKFLTYKSEVNALDQCATLAGGIYGKMKKKINKTLVDFTVCFDRKCVKIWRPQYL